MPSQIELIKKHNLSIRGNLGQHLLIDSNIQRKIVDLLEIKKDEVVFEIGPGLGAITGEILKRGARVYAIEKDKRFAAILETEYRSIAGKRLTVFSEDVLKFGFKKAFQDIGSKTPRVKVVSNIPYYITAPILMRLVENRQHFSEAVLMMQKEVGSRLLAGPGTKAYGRLTLAVRYYAEVAHAFNVAPSCFRPKPEVQSSVLRLRFHKQNASKDPIDEEFLFYIIRVAFSQRRKTLLNLLSRDARVGMRREDLEKYFKKKSWSSTIRGEELLLKDFMELSADLKKKGAES